MGGRSDRVGDGPELVIRRISGRSGRGYELPSSPPLRCMLYVVCCKRCVACCVCVVGVYLDMVLYFVFCSWTWKSRMRMPRLLCSFLAPLRISQWFPNKSACCSCITLAIYCVCVRACVRARARARVCVCVCITDLSLHAHAHMHICTYT